MKRAWKAFWDELAASLELHAAEARTGVTLIEVVAANEFEVQLRAVTGSAQEANEMREIALDAAKCGLNPEGARAAFEQWVRLPYQLEYELGLIKRYVDGRIKANE